MSPLLYLPVKYFLLLGEPLHLKFGQDVNTTASPRSSTLALATLGRRYDFSNTNNTCQSITISHKDDLTERLTADCVTESTPRSTTWVPQVLQPNQNYICRPYDEEHTAMYLSYRLSE